MSVIGKSSKRVKDYPEEGGESDEDLIVGVGEEN